MLTATKPFRISGHVIGHIDLRRQHRIHRRALREISERSEFGEPELARRIKLPKSHSFPSGHSLLSAATYPIVAHHLVQNRSVATQAFVHTLAGMTILLVGFSRVYFGVHFPSDVLGGFAAGFGWLGLTSLSHTVVERRGPENR